MAGANNPVKVLEVCRVVPSIDSPGPATAELIVPVTLFDTLWFRFLPVERIFFYELPALSGTPHFFNSVILPKLKHSLSLTLLHFLPLAGNLIWAADAPKPVIRYELNDGVLFTVAESNAEFNQLSGDSIREAIESHHYVPQLPVSDSKASIIALQITLFPNQGFSIGVSAHHAILDGKSTTMFLRAWAHVCKHQNEQDNNGTGLLPELTPFFDRSVIQDPKGLDIEHLKIWSGLKWPGWEPSPGSLELLPGVDISGLVRATFNISRQDIQRLRERVLDQLVKDPEEAHQDPDEAKRAIKLSTFVLVFAYAGSCIAKAKLGKGDNMKVYFGFTADCRARLDPPVPANYFGNCVSAHVGRIELGTLMAENGVAMAAQVIGQVVKGLEKIDVENITKTLAEFVNLAGAPAVVSTAGSPQFKVYETDFGWGRPKKVEISSIDRTGAMSLAESADGSGGVEVGLVLKKHEMETFEACFVSGLRDLSSTH